MEPENGKTDNVNENENKENKNVQMSVKNTFCNKTSEHKSKHKVCEGVEAVLFTTTRKYGAV